MKQLRTAMSTEYLKMLLGWGTGIVALLGLWISYGIKAMVLGVVGIYVTYFITKSKDNLVLESCEIEQEHTKDELQEQLDSDKELKKENIIFEDVFDKMNQLIALISTDGTLLYTNKAMLDFTGQERNELIGQPYWDLSIWQHSEEQQNKVLFSIQEAFQKESVRFATTHYNVSDEINEIDFIIKAVRDEQGEVSHLIAMGYNITELVNAQKALTSRERQIKAFFDYSIDGYFFYLLPQGAKLRRILSDEEIIEVIEHQEFKEFNPALSGLMEIRDNEIKNTRFDKLFNISEELMIESWRNLITEGVIQVEVNHPDPLDGKTLTLEITLVAIWEDDWEFIGNFGVVRDITGQREYENKLEFLANKDYMTGIDNRRTFFRKSSEILEKNRFSNEKLFVMIFDLDFFKSVNDNYGHDTGDEVLKRVCKLCSDSLPENTVFARYGGEEFTLIIEAANKDKVCEFAESIRQIIKDEKFKYKDIEFNVTISLGATTLGKEEIRVDEALTRADKALYEAKGNGRNRVEWSEL